MLFRSDGFDRASIDRFWLAVDAPPPPDDRDRITAALERAGALRIVWLTGVPEET